MDLMMSRTIDTRNTKRDTVMDVDGPHRDNDKGQQVHSTLHGEEEDKNLIRGALQVAIQRVERKRGVWGGVDEGMMRLVHSFVNEAMVQAAVDKVDDTVTKQQKEQRRDAKIQVSVLSRICVNFSIAVLKSDFRWRGHASHNGQRTHRHGDFAAQVDGIEIAWGVKTMT